MGLLLTQPTETGYVLTRTTETGLLWPAIPRMKNKHQCAVASSITATNIAESIEIVDYTIPRLTGTIIHDFGYERNRCS
jgi:hypothetical protein